VLLTNSFDYRYVGLMKDLENVIPILTSISISSSSLSSRCLCFGPTLAM
jgi:hypothetical protein